MSCLHLPPRSVPLLIALVLQVAACGRIRAGFESTPGEVFTNSIEEFDASGDLDTHARTAPEPSSVAFFEHLRELDLWLDEHPEAQEVAAGWFPEEKRSRLPQLIKSLDRFYRDLDRLLTAPETLSAIQEGRALARRPSVHLDERVNASCAAPELEHSLLWIDLLCARSLVLAGDARTAADSVHALAQAFDLIRLLDDGSLLSLHVSHELGTRVVQALQIVMPGATLHPRLVREQIEPRLAFASRRGRLAHTLRRESAHRMIAAKNLALGSRQERQTGAQDKPTELPPAVVQRVREFNLAVQLLELSGGVRRGSELCSLAAGADAPPRVLEIMRSTHDFDMYSALARTALAINESRWLHGEWPSSLGILTNYSGSRPAPPCLNRTLNYERSFQKVRLSATSRRGLGMPDDALQEWIWDRKTISQLRSADL